VSQAHRVHLCFVFAVTAETDPASVVKREAVVDVGDEGLRGEPVEGWLCSEVRQRFLPRAKRAASSPGNGGERIALRGPHRCVGREHNRLIAVERSKGARPGFLCKEQRSASARMAEPDGVYQAELVHEGGDIRRKSSPFEPPAAGLPALAMRSQVDRITVESRSHRRCERLEHRGAKTRRMSEKKGPSLASHVVVGDVHAIGREHEAGWLKREGGKPRRTTGWHVVVKLPCVLYSPFRTGRPARFGIMRPSTARSARCMHGPERSAGGWLQLEPIRNVCLHLAGSISVVLWGCHGLSLVAVRPLRELEGLARARRAPEAGKPFRVTQETWNVVDDYIVETLVDEDAVLIETSRASLGAGLPPIAVAPNQGKLLHLLARMLGATRILEVGTLGGYSAIWLARALPPAGRVITLELDPKHAEVAQANIDRAGLTDKVEIRLGEASETLRLLSQESAGPFDLVFIDADKPSTPEYLTRAIELSRPGGLIVIDNVVRGGKIIEEHSDDSAIQGIRRANEILASDPRLMATAIQTVGSKGYDGLAIALVASSG
jgi:predicted O-methyltransferase YrrM